MSVVYGKVVLVDRADEQLRSLNRVEICRLNTRSLTTPTINLKKREINAYLPSTF